MSITEKINNIRKAVLGRDVRESIASSIEECYKDASTKDNANMEVKQARGTYNVLGDRLNNTDNNISNLKSTKADKKDLEETNKNVAVNSARIDTFTSLPSGSTAGNAELQDIRVMADGTTASTAGEAVRKQVNTLNTNINDYTCISEVKFDWVYGKGTKLDYDIGSTVTFANITNSVWKTAIVDCKEGDIYSTTNTIIGNELNALGFVDSANKLIKASDKSFWQNDSSIRYFEVPKNAVKFIVNTISSNDDCRYFKGEKLLYNKNIPCYRIVGTATFISKGKSGVTGNNQIFYHKGSKSFAISKNYDSNVKFDYDYLPTIKGATFILGDKTLNYHDGKISCNEDVINISGFGSVSGKNTGVTEAGQFYININDGKLKLVTYYNSSNSDIEDLTIEFDTNSIYVYKNKFYKYTGKGNFYGLSQIEINIGSNIDWTETNKNIALGNVSIGDTVSFEPEKIYNYRYAIIECNPHDLFLLKVSGGVTPRAWAFADKNKKLLKRAGISKSLENCIIEAPDNACYLIVNNNDNLCKVPQISHASLSDIYNDSMYSSKNREKEIAKIAEDDICSFIKGISFADELNNHLIDFTKTGDLMVHVSTICIINNIIYCTYYANTKSAKENPEEHTARFAYCPLSDTANITFVDLQTIGDTFDSKTITKIYDTIMIKKDDDTLYLMWTASLGDDNYYRLYRTYTISTGTLSEVMCNNFKVNEDTDVWNVNNMISLIDNNNITHRNINGDIGLMQKVTEHMENEEKYYYTGAYVGSFNCIVKSKDLITWEYVSAPNFINEAQWENATYVIGDKVYYFVRQYSNNSTGFLTRYDLNEKTWESPVFINDCQSRSDFFEYNNNLYLVHAPKDRNHISIMKIDKNNLNKSTEIQTAKVSDYFYPFTCVYNNELYMSFTQSRKHIYVSKFTINSMSEDTIISKFKKLFFE